jgi:hypothetical protein
MDFLKGGSFYRPFCRGQEVFWCVTKVKKIYSYFLLKEESHV